jgi:hypothetical protein
MVLRWLLQYRYLVQYLMAFSYCLICLLPIATVCYLAAIESAVTVLVPSDGYRYLLAITWQLQPNLYKLVLPLAAALWQLLCWSAAVKSIRYYHRNQTISRRGANIISRRPSHGHLARRCCPQDSRKFYFVKNLYITKPYHPHRCMYFRDTTPWLIIWWLC